MNNYKGVTFLSTTEYNGTIKYRDKDGNIHITYPVTKVQNVIGLANVLSSKQDVLSAGSGIIIEDGVIKVTDNLIESHVVTEDSYFDFPAVGDGNTIYIASDTGRSYKWDTDELKYICIGTDYNAIELIDGSYE